MTIRWAFPNEVTVDGRASNRQQGTSTLTPVQQAVARTFLDDSIETFLHLGAEPDVAARVLARKHRKRLPNGNTLLADSIRLTLAARLTRAQRAQDKIFHFDSGTGLLALVEYVDLQTGQPVAVEYADWTWRWG